MKTLNRMLFAGLAGCILGLPLAAMAATPAAAQFRGINPIEKFDVSPELRHMTPLPVPDMRLRAGEMQDDKLSHLQVPFGYQDYDPIVQREIHPPRIPAPLTSFDAQGNLSGVSPPDPVGDVGPNHYVAMSNLSLQIFNKSGVSQFGPALTNSLWAGFGGACQTENSGDPIVLHDQFADRWLITQFTSAGPIWYNCLALSTSADPLGTYYRYAISTGGNFPDYPKYGVWSDAYVISTREFLGSGGPFQGVGAYALNRAQMLAGNPNPTVISFLATPTPAYNVGDGLLPADIDGTQLPPAGAPAYFVGSMDNGGSYGAPQDALTLWKFTINFTTPASSSFVLAHTIPITPFDTVYPCSGRNCIPQSGTTNQLDILSYRQRPTNRLAYRNFGTHESLVTTQSVEATTAIAGMRWWEIRSPNITPVLYQEGTYAPAGGLNRWMGSVAMDSSGNMALGYSTSSAATFPSIAYTGRLVTDPVGTMPQGEQFIVTGTGSQTGSQRWGDYTSMNVDPTDDCTFWYVNQYLPTTGSNWRLRVGSFRFAECGTPTFTLNATPPTRNICVGGTTTYALATGSIAGFTNPVTLSQTGLPAPAAAAFAPNPVTTPGSSTMTVSNTSGLAAGSYPITIQGTASGSPARTAVTQLVVYATAPAAPALLVPTAGAINQSLRPGFQWSGSNAESYTLQVATDAAFSNIVFTTTISTTSVAPSSDLASNTQYYWRVRANNTCGSGSYSPVSQFRTAQLICFNGTVAIPDNSATGITTALIVTGTGTLTDLDLSTMITHTYPGDLELVLSNGTTTVNVGTRLGGTGCGVANVDVTLDDEAASAIACGATPPGIAGVARPTSPLSAFDGASLNGTWSLRINDRAAQDTGSLTQFCLRPTLSNDVIFRNGFDSTP